MDRDTETESLQSGYLMNERYFGRRFRPHLETVIGKDGITKTSYRHRWKSGGKLRGRTYMDIATDAMSDEVLSREEASSKGNTEKFGRALESE